MNNPFTKPEPKFMTKEEIKELKDKVKSRKEEIDLRKEQMKVESEFNILKKGSKINFDPEKLKKGAIIIVAGLAITFIVIKVIGKFI